MSAAGGHRGLITALVSLVAHAALVGGVAWFAYRALETRHSKEVEERLAVDETMSVAVDLERAAEVSPAPGAGRGGRAPAGERAHEQRVRHLSHAHRSAAKEPQQPNASDEGDEEVAHAVGQIVHANTTWQQRGEERGAPSEEPTERGRAAPPSVRGSGAGAGAGATGDGESEVIDWNTRDPGLRGYFRGVHAKVDPLAAKAFPRSALLELKQGTVILEFTIHADGTAKVNWPPARSSGIDEFDRNCAEAIRKASPFEPLPAWLRARGWTRLRVRAPFVSKSLVLP